MPRAPGAWGMGHLHPPQAHGTPLRPLCLCLVEQPACALPCTHPHTTHPTTHPHTYTHTCGAWCTDVSVVGHSAGAHLAMMAVLHHAANVEQDVELASSCRAAFGAPSQQLEEPVVPAACIGICGIYELGKVRAAGLAQRGSHAPSVNNSSVVLGLCSRGRRGRRGLAPPPPPPLPHPLTPIQPAQQHQSDERSSWCTPDSPLPASAPPTLQTPPPRPPPAQSHTPAGARLRAHQGRQRDLPHEARDRRQHQVLRPLTGAHHGARGAAAGRQAGAGGEGGRPWRPRAAACAAARVPAAGRRQQAVHGHRQQQRARSSSSSSSGLWGRTRGALQRPRLRSRGRRGRRRQPPQQQRLHRHGRGAPHPSARCCSAPWLRPACSAALFAHHSMLLPEGRPRQEAGCERPGCRRRRRRCCSTAPSRWWARRCRIAWA
jgi:hypothetical protein